MSEITRYCHIINRNKLTMWQMLSDSVDSTLSFWQTTITCALVLSFLFIETVTEFALKRYGTSWNLVNGKLYGIYSRRYLTNTLFANRTSVVSTILPKCTSTFQPRRDNNCKPYTGTIEWASTKKQWRNNHLLNYVNQILNQRDISTKVEEEIN